MLIPIFATHFVQARFKQAQLSCELNSCIILYFILLSMAQAHATYGEIEEVWFGGYGSDPFGPFAWAQPMRATKCALSHNDYSQRYQLLCLQSPIPLLILVLPATCNTRWVFFFFFFFNVVAFSVFEFQELGFIFFFYNYFFNIYWKFSFCLGFWWAIFLLWLLVLTVETNNVYYVPTFGCVLNYF